jgi:hypothetical protein
MRAARREWLVLAGPSQGRAHKATTGPPVTKETTGWTMPARHMRGNRTPPKRRSPANGGAELLRSHISAASQHTAAHRRGDRD